MISAISGATFSASLRTGTTMETATAPLSELVKSELVWLVWKDPEPGISVRLAASAFMGRKRLGQPF